MWVAFLSLFFKIIMTTTMMINYCFIILIGMEWYYEYRKDHNNNIYIHVSFLPEIFCNKCSA